MKQLSLFVCLILVAALASGQENKIIQVPPIKTVDNFKAQTVNPAQATVPNRTVDNVKAQSANAVQTVAIKTADNVQQPKTGQVIQTVPLRKTDNVGTVQSSNIVNSTNLNKASVPAGPDKLQPPSSISSKQAQEQIQKAATATKKSD